jgi:hypothetical protein
MADEFRMVGYSLLPDENDPAVTNGLMGAGSADERLCPLAKFESSAGHVTARRPMTDGQTENSFLF